MVLRKVCIFLVLKYIHLELVITAPCKVNSTVERIKNNQLSGAKSLKIVARILTRPNNTDQESLIGGIFGEDTVASFSSQDIIFPDKYEQLFKPIAPIEATPPCADDLSFCEEIETYPYNKLKNVLQTRGNHNEYFGIDEAPPEIANRIGDPEESFICQSVDTTIFPKAGRNKNNKWKYIVNQEQEGFVQGIRIEKCLKLDGPCNLITGAPLGYVATCKQKYILRRLLSLTESGEPTPDSFHIPSACCCSFKKDLSYLSNYGRSVSSSLRPQR